jgi:hypothetical protein
MEKLPELRVDRLNRSVITNEIGKDLSVETKIPDCGSPNTNQNSALNRS